MFALFSAPAPPPNAVEVLKTELEPFVLPKPVFVAVPPAPTVTV
jgi:hypothetical protein